MNKELERISKFLSLVLRHKPQVIGLSLDPGGWADVDELIERANRAGVDLDMELLLDVVEKGEKQRFSLNKDCTRIRANYGHSLRVDLGLEPMKPPETLYHGTAQRYLEAIRRDGLQPSGRSFVHLSGDAVSARQVGQRHGLPVVLLVRAGQMHADGYYLYRTAAGVWLTKNVPPQYLDFPFSEEGPPAEQAEQE